MPIEFAIWSNWATWVFRVPTGKRNLPTPGACWIPVMRAVTRGLASTETKLRPTDKAVRMSFRSPFVCFGGSSSATMAPMLSVAADLALPIAV